MNNFSDSILHVIKVVSETTTPTSQVPESICVSTTNGFDVLITSIICLTIVVLILLFAIVLCFNKHSQKELAEIKQSLEEIKEKVDAFVEKKEKEKEKENQN